MTAHTICAFARVDVDRVGMLRPTSFDMKLAASNTVLAVSDALRSGELLKNRMRFMEVVVGSLTSV